MRRGGQSRRLRSHVGASRIKRDVGPAIPRSAAGVPNINWTFSSALAITLDPITPSFVLLPNCPSSEHNLMGCLHSQCADLAVWFCHSVSAARVLLDKRRHKYERQ